MSSPHTQLHVRRHASIIIAEFSGFLTDNLIPLAFMVPLGLSQGLNVRVGNLLGEQKVQSAKRLVLCTLLISTLVLLFNGLAVWLARAQVIRIYSSEPSLKNTCMQIWSVHTNPVRALTVPYAIAGLGCACS